MRGWKEHPPTYRRSQPAARSAVSKGPMASKATTLAAPVNQSQHQASTGSDERRTYSAVAAMPPQFPSGTVKQSKSPASATSSPPSLHLEATAASLMMEPNKSGSYVASLLQPSVTHSVVTQPAGTVDAHSVFDPNRLSKCTHWHLQKLRHMYHLSFDYSDTSFMRQTASSMAKQSSLYPASLPPPPPQMQSLS